MVANIGDLPPSLAAQEAATALAAIAREPAALVTACRRLIESQPACAPLWWLSARVLAAPDPVAEAQGAAQELAADDTVDHVVAALPLDGRVVVIGWPELAGAALELRPDAWALVVDGGSPPGSSPGWSPGWSPGRSAAAGLADRPHRGGSDAEAVPASGVAAAVLEADVVLVEALAAAPEGVLARAGSRAAAAVATDAGVEVWAVVGAGRVLPAELWSALRARLAALRDDAPAWESGEEVVPARLLGHAVAPGGLLPSAEVLARAGCLPVPELVRWSPA